MEPLILEQTDRLPGIHFNKATGKFEIKGTSFPEDSRVFYGPVFDWLNKYEKDPNDFTLFAFKMDYFNSSSSLMILEMLHVLDRIFVAGKKVKVYWFYLSIDIDMLDAGKEYATMVSVPFTFEPIEEESELK
ncbi:MAG: hypothetical protein A2W99_15055 [Bacteroidetes bacterium GWF2_33_16]|nr:MAG: hypothetical protein A2X00_00030 [Bacteroidetes bacterium GWE2_32_14]OFY07644.1 MAG: hypothetical protein A2W99_15055 [Bacteroidetes bacterium GWF2_33_16]